MKRTKLIHLTKHRNVLEYIILAMLIYLYVSEHSAGTKTSFILVNDLVKFETCYKQNNVRLIRRGKKYRQKQDLKKKKKQLENQPIRSFFIQLLSLLG